MRWIQENEVFRDFIAASKLPALTVSYDLLAESPVSGYRRLFEFCGMEFSREALAYWRVEHHGFAANGATDAVLKSGTFEKMPHYFVTGDDEFYLKNSGTFFRDERWRSALSREEMQAIQKHRGVRDLLGSFGFKLTDHGIKVKRRWPWSALPG